MKYNFCDVSSLNLEPSKTEIMELMQVGEAYLIYAKELQNKPWHSKLRNWRNAASRYGKKSKRRYSIKLSENNYYYLIRNA